MPYRAPNSHIWFRSPSPIYSPPTPPPQNATLLPQANALLQVIEDVSATRFQTKKKSAAESTGLGSRSSKATAPTSTPSKAFNHKGDGQQSISNYMVGSDSSCVRTSKGNVNKSTPYRAKPKPSGNTKIVFDRIPTHKARDVSLPIIAGLQKQQVIANKRKLDEEAFPQGCREPGKPKRAQISSTTNSFPPRSEACSAPSSSTRGETETQVPHDWLVENLDLLLPPLTEEDIIELSEEGKEAVSQGSPSFNPSSSVQSCSYGSTQLSLLQQAPKKPALQHTYQVELPLSKQPSAWESLDESQSQTAVGKHYTVNRTVCDNDNIACNIGEEDIDINPLFRPDSPLGNRLEHDKLGDLFQRVQPACEDTRHPASQPTIINPSLDDPYRHPDFQEVTGAVWSTLPRGSVKRTNHLPKPTKIALSKKFTLPANVFGQVSKPPLTSRPKVKAAVSPLPLRKGVKLFKPAPPVSPQSGADGALYTVHTSAGMRYGPALHCEEPRSESPWSKTSSNSEPPADAPSIHSSAGTPRKLQSFASEGAQFEDWSESAPMKTSSSPSSGAETLVNIEAYTNHKQAWNITETAPTFPLEPTRTYFISNLPPQSSPPASPTIAFSLQEARCQYVKWRAMLEYGRLRKTEGLTEEVLMERVGDLVGSKYGY